MKIKLVNYVFKCTDHFCKHYKEHKKCYTIVSNDGTKLPKCPFCGRYMVYKGKTQKVIEK